jgi:hypothetical protein
MACDLILPSSYAIALQHMDVNGLRRLVETIFPGEGYSNAQIEDGFSLIDLSGRGKIVFTDFCEVTLILCCALLILRGVLALQASFFHLQTHGTLKLANAHSCEWFTHLERTLMRVVLPA